LLPVRSFVKLENGKVEARFRDGGGSGVPALAAGIMPRLLFNARFTWPMQLAARRQRRKLELVLGPSAGDPSRRIVAVVPYYGDHRFLGWFLDFYRNLGVSLFVFLDLSKRHDLATHAGSAADIAIWRLRDNLRMVDALHALNHLRHRYARNRWCLSVEPYDLLVFPKSETRHLGDLTDFMKNEGQNHLYAIVVDAYGEQPANQIAFNGTRAPLEHLPWFDRVGYETISSVERSFDNVRGGVQRRRLFADRPHHAPYLNCIPLVMLKPDYFYICANRQMIPSHLNRAHGEIHSSISACILRFAMLTDSESLHIAKQLEAARHQAGQAAPLYAGSEALAKVALKTEGSFRFRSSQDLVDCGLLNVGQWF